MYFSLSSICCLEIVQESQHFNPKVKLRKFWGLSGCSAKGLSLDPDRVLTLDCIALDLNKCLFLSAAFFARHSALALVQLSQAFSELGERCFPHIRGVMTVPPGTDTTPKSRTWAQPTGWPLSHQCLTTQRSKSQGIIVVIQARE